MFYRVNGGSTQLEGVKSDLIFPNRYSYVDIGEKDLDNPINWNEIDPARYDNSAKIFNYSKAIEKSKKRISENEYFSLIDQHAKLVKSRQDDKVISLEYKSYKEDQDNFKFQNNKLKVIDDFISPYVFDWNDSNQNSDSIYNDDMKEKRDRWIETLKKDIYVNEAMNLLKDLTSIEGGQILSQLNKN